MSQVIQVAVAIIVSSTQTNAEQQSKRYFLTKRATDVHQGGKWEFPGGKVEIDETIAQALARELKEEVDIDILSCQALTTITHDYVDKKVCLAVFIVDNYAGEPSSQEGLEEGWFTLEALQALDFPEANQAIIAKLITHNS